LDFVVLEKNPPKQGLKLGKIKKVEDLRDLVLEKNPPKQGLKPLKQIGSHLAPLLF